MFWLSSQTAPFFPNGSFFPKCIKLNPNYTICNLHSKITKISSSGQVFPQFKKLKTLIFFPYWIGKPKSSISLSKTIEIESEMEIWEKTVMKVELHLQSPSLMVMWERLNIGVLEFVLLENPILQKTQEGHQICLFEVFNMVLYCSRRV